MKYLRKNEFIKELTLFLKENVYLDIEYNHE
jgi:hypothetical protein